MPYKDREKQRAYDRIWRRKKRKVDPDYNAKRRVHNRNHCRAWAEWFLRVKMGQRCRKCGEDHPACLDFHHRDPSTKLFNISRAVLSQMSKVKILAEIAKCDVLCANCHRKAHWKKTLVSAGAAV
jgi:hypothetical protein